MDEFLRLIPSRLLEVAPGAAHVIEVASEAAADSLFDNSRSFTACG